MGSIGVYPFFNDKKANLFLFNEKCPSGLEGHLLKAGIRWNQNQEPIQVLLAFPPANFRSLLPFSMKYLISV